jgi:DNA polymerase-2
MARGFILQPTYRIESGRPVVLLYGTLEDGGSFLVRETRQLPRFYVLQSDAERVAALGLSVGDAEGATTMRGEPVARGVVALPRDSRRVLERLVRAGIPSFEADVRFAYRYLIDRGVRGTLEIRGPSAPGEGIDHVFDSPSVTPADWTPRLAALSIDIETDPRAERLLSVALCGCGVSEVLLLTPPGYDCPATAIPFETERDLLRGMVDRIRQIDPDVITGWNVIDFDLAVLQRMARRRGVPLKLGRGAEPVRILPASSPRGSSRAQIVGRVVLDGIQLLRGAFVKVERYGLNAVAHEILGRGKTITGPDRAGEILTAFEEDRPHLVRYNLNDAKLVLEILDRLRLLELSVERSRLTGLPPDRVGGSIAAFDFLYLSELRKRNLVGPTVGTTPGSELPTSGGHVLDPQPGLYRNILVFDFKSLYPSVIRTFQIDPLGLVPAPEADDDLIRAPGGAAFRREPGILPRLLDDLFPRREAARAAGDAVASQAIKILMNSFYGVLGSSACRFADPALANAITGLGREILLWSKRRIEELGYPVLYGDTDSLFVVSHEEEPGAARALGHRVAREINRELARHVRRSWNVESRLELQFEKLYLRLLLPVARHAKTGARKRYAGLVETADGTEVVYTGLEVVRRDWTELAKRVQRELYGRLFADRAVDDYLRQIVAEVRAGRRDDLLVYRKGLRRPLASYTASTPQHVAAARKMSGKPGRVVSYVLTENGPEPADERRSAIDHEHYVQKQVRAVAEPILSLLGLDFDRVVGDESQLRLF